MKPKFTFGRYIITLLLTVSLCVVLYLSSVQNRHEWESILLNVRLASVTSQGHIDKLMQDNAELSEQISTLSAEISELRQEVEHKQDKADRGEPRGERRIMEVTAYWEGSCGKAPDDPEYGITSSGKYVQDGYIAAGPEFKIGQQIHVPYFNKTFTVMDRGKDITNGHLDVYMPTEKLCNEFGRVYGMEVVVVD